MRWYSIQYVRGQHFSFMILTGAILSCDLGTVFPDLLYPCIPQSDAPKPSSVVPLRAVDILVVLPSFRLHDGNVERGEEKIQK